MTIGRLFKALIKRIVYLLAPVKKNKVVMMFFDGRSYGGNPKYIAEALMKEYPECEIYWVVKEGEDLSLFPKQIKTVNLGTIAQDYHFASATVLVNNCRCNYRIKKKKQWYLQTWHGAALKRIEKDVADKLSREYVRNAPRDSKMTDLLLSDSNFMTDVFRRAYWYDGKIAQWGVPRNEIFFDSEKMAAAKKKIDEYFGCSEETKYVLYAPTFRADGSLEPYSVDYQRLKNVCQERFGGEFKVVVRLHPNIAAKSAELGLDANWILDGSGYADMQELLAAMDLAITDYSSVILDFSLTRRPCFRFATDIEEYKKDRDFYIQLEELPFPLCEDNDSLEKAIASFSEDDYAKELEAFYDKIGLVRTPGAAEKCARAIAIVCKYGKNSDAYRQLMDEE